MSMLSEGLKALGSGISNTGRDIQRGYSGLEADINAAVPAFSNTGNAIGAYLEPRTPEIMGVGGKDLWRVFYDPMRDNPISQQRWSYDKTANLLSGQKVFDEPGDVEYNQNLLKRAAMVAAVFGGAAAAGGAGAAGAGGSAGAGGAGTAAAGSGTATTAGGAGAGVSGFAGVPYAAPAAEAAPVLSAGPLASAAPAAGTATPGTTAAMYETLGATAPAATPGTTGAMYSSIGATAPAAAPGGIDAAMAGSTATQGGGFWSSLKDMNPAYVSAGASIMSSLFSGLMQMEQQKEEQERQRQMALAKSKVERAQAQNAALDRLIQVWQGAKR